jgi:NAD(P)-dependent dehydrogenase (short-subunit alcohol dehydrogenase family)
MSNEPADVIGTPLGSFPGGGRAVVIGGSGGIGLAILEQLLASARFADVVGLSRHSMPPLDITAASSIESAAAVLAGDGLPLRLVVVATGILHGGRMLPEKSWREIDADSMAHAFLINAIGPALLMKHFLPLLPLQGKSVFAVLSARVGSIGDNRLGGWYSYRASKAALNQLVHTAAIELARSRPQAVCVALHPGTVATRLSAPYSKSQAQVQSPQLSASRLLSVIDGLDPSRTGSFVDHFGKPVDW